ncbi:hypothetical protein Q1695_013278 [Nippostrongylus brasiliensis]|nr:hypothetical protein Q1695_013278 [Nippostrongylus brasiliensis]
MLIIYWLAVVFHLSLAGEVKPMPSMDPATRLFIKEREGLEAYVVLQRRTWYDAVQHCKQYNLRLPYIFSFIPIPVIRDKIKQLTGKMPDPNGVLWLNSKFTDGSGCFTVWLMAPTPASLFFRKCNQTTDKDKYGKVLLGYLCVRDHYSEA